MKPLICALFTALTATLHADALRIHASPALAQAIASVANPLKEQGVELKIVNEGGSTAAIAAVGSRAADVALTTRRLNASDRAANPDRRFEEFQIGFQVVAVIVPRDVWESGVHSLTRAQLLRIYEREITNWKDVGGQDHPIKFYNSDRGRGVWEVFVQWLYGDPRKAPLGKFEVLIGGEDASNTVEFNAGSIGLAAPRWVDGKGTFALALKDGDGEAVDPSPQNLAAGKYPLTRPAMLICGTRPAGGSRRLIDYLLSSPGQDLVHKSDLVPIRIVKPDVAY